ncbi:MAG TPA: hypothetical protein VG347_10515 [Verrucomicrobiae bacterium]|nr:hypothetical protein [Verrucomicrobiae bacterium]
MTQYTKTVPKDPAGLDATLKAVLQVIIFQTQDGDLLADFQIKPDKVLLIFDEE